jgi:hypothetical protein
MHIETIDKKMDIKDIEIAFDAVETKQDKGIK